MSPSGSSEHVTLLREAISRIEAGGGASAEQEDAGASLARRRAAFFEIAPAHALDSAAATGFALALAKRFQEGGGGAVLWIAEDFALAEWGAPYGPGLAAYDLSLRDVILMRMARTGDVWLAMEEAIRARAFGAIVAEPASLRGIAGEDAPKLIRRLAMAARTAGSRAILLRPPASERLPFLAPTPMRFEISARPSPRPSAGRKPLPGAQSWRVRHTGPPGSLPGLKPGALHDFDLQQTTSQTTSQTTAEEDFFSVALSLGLPSHPRRPLGRVA